MRRQGVTKKKSSQNINEMEQFQENKCLDSQDVNNISFSQSKKASHQLFGDLNDQQQHYDDDLSRNEGFSLNISQNNLVYDQEQSFRNKGQATSQINIDQLSIFQEAKKLQQQAYSSLSAIDKLEKSDSKLSPKFKERSQQQLDPNRKSLFAQIVQQPLNLTKNQSSNYNNNLEYSKQLSQQSNQKYDQQKKKSSNIFFFKKTNIMKKFLTNLLSYTRSYNFKNLTKKQFDMIEDQCADYQYYQDKHLILKKVTIFICFVIIFSYVVPNQKDYSKLIFSLKQSPLIIYLLFLSFISIISICILLDKYQGESITTKFNKFRISNISFQLPNFSIIFNYIQQIVFENYLTQSEQIIISPVIYIPLITKILINDAYFKSVKLIKLKQLKDQSDIHRIFNLQLDFMQNNNKIMLNNQQDSMFVIVWDVITTLLWLCIVFYIPFRVNFELAEKTEEDQQITTFQILIIFFLFIETFIKLNKVSLFFKSIEEYQSDLLKRQFSKGVGQLLQESILFAELRILRIFKTYKELFQKFDQETKHEIFRRISLLVLFVLCFINLQGSIFILFGFDDDLHMQNKLKLPNDTILSRYVAGLYWSTITMTTIGYGDIVAITNIERVYVSIVTLISCGIFGYSISQIQEIMAEIQRKSDSFNKKMQCLNKLMNSRQLSKKMMYQVIKYYEYLHKESEESKEEEGVSMIENLPKSMRDMIIYEMNHKLFYQRKLFSLNFSKSFIDQLCLKAKTMKIGPESDLYKQGEFDQRLFFILKGEITLYIQQNQIQKDCSVLNKGDMFGEIEFFSQTARKFGAKSTSVVSLIFIDFEDFYQILQQHERDFVISIFLKFLNKESYNLMKDELRLENNLKILNRKCESCGSYNHLFFNCKQLKYIPNLQKIFHSENRKIFQERDLTHKRQRKRSINALQNFSNSGIEIQELFSNNNPSEYNNQEELSSPQCLPQITSVNEERESVEQEHITSLTVIRDKQKSISNDIYNKQSSLPQQQFIRSAMKKESQKLLQINDQHFQNQDETKQLFDSLRIKFLPENNSINQQISNLIGAQQSQLEPQQELSSPSDRQLNKKCSFNKKQNTLLGNNLDFINQDNPQNMNKIKVSIVQSDFQFPQSDQGQSLDKFIQQNNSIFIWLSDFEKAKNYLIYYPLNNLQNVLIEYRQHQIKMMKQKVKRQSKNQKQIQSKLRKDRSKKKLSTSQLEQSLLSLYNQSPINLPLGLPN